MDKGGRPPKLTSNEMEILVEKFKEYIGKTDIPIIAEFAYMNDIDRTWLYDQKQFSTLLKKCVAKKETALERGVLNGTLNATMGVFSLKQLGWKDRAEKIIFVDPKSLSESELKKLMDDGS